MYAAEMGCDWVYPQPYKPNVTVTEETLYCHLETTNGRQAIKKGDTLIGPTARCTLNNWLAYFSFRDQMVPAEVSHTTAVIVVSLPQIVVFLHFWAMARAVASRHAPSRAVTIARDWTHAATYRDKTNPFLCVPLVG